MQKQVQSTQAEAKAEAKPEVKAKAKQEAEQLQMLNSVNETTIQGIQ